MSMEGIKRMKQEKIQEAVDVLTSEPQFYRDIILRLEKYRNGKVNWRVVGRCVFLWMGRLNISGDCVPVAEAIHNHYREEVYGYDEAIKQRQEEIDVHIESAAESFDKVAANLRKSKMAKPQEVIMPAVITRTTNIPARKGDKIIIKIGGEPESNISDGQLVELVKNHVREEEQMRKMAADSGSKRLTKEADHIKAVREELVALLDAR